MHPINITKVSMDPTFMQWYTKYIADLKIKNETEAANHLSELISHMNSLIDTLNKVLAYSSIQAIYADAAIDVIRESFQHYQGDKPLVDSDLSTTMLKSLSNMSDIAEYKAAVEEQMMAIDSGVRPS